MIKIITITLSTLLISFNLIAGVIIVTKTEAIDCNENNRNGTSTMYLRDDIMRMDVKDEQSSIKFIYQKAEGNMWVLDDKKKEYYTITKEELDDINKKLEQAKAMMEERLQSLPEAQREQMKQMLKKNGSIPGTKMEKEYEKKSGTKTINSWICEQYECKVEEELKEIHWVAKTADLGIDKNDFQILFDLSEFLKNSIGNFDFGSSNAAVSSDRPYDGYPVSTIHMKNGKECYSSTVESITKATLSDEFFVIPKDYRKNEKNFK